MSCPLCTSEDKSLYFRDERRLWSYFECPVCRLVYRDPQTYLQQGEEKKRYETHNNSIENVGYVKFLSPVVDVLKPYLSPGLLGLDFGCGPGPILDKLLEPHHVVVKNFDPYFFNNRLLLTETFDFITCTEAFEHFYNPGLEMEKLYSMLKPDGLLLLMTEPYPDQSSFNQWGYRTDNTHVCFLCDETLQWMETKWGYERLYSKGRLSLFKKKLSTTL